jgi:2-hydroxychromene-2-carboxylate isomerase
LTSRERINFHFDPLCPWAWITSRWATRMEDMGEIEIDWRLFSLGVVHVPQGEEVPDEPFGPSGLALQLLAQARRLEGNSGVGRLYTALGTAAHVRRQPLAEEEVLAGAWEQARFDSAAREAAEADPTLWQQVLTEHRAAVTACQAFGVPTIVLDGGSGPGIFGPVLTEVPADDEGRELLRDVLRLTRRGYFFELKRDREGYPPKLGA